MARPGSYTYANAGYNGFLRRTINSDPNANSLRELGRGNKNTINFDQMLVSGSIGDKVNVGLITLDGKNGSIIISDGSDIRAILGGEISE